MKNHNDRHRDLLACSAVPENNCATVPISVYIRLMHGSWITSSWGIHYTGCASRYRTRHFFNNFTTNGDIATKFKTDLPHCVRSVTTSWHVLQVATICVQTGSNAARHILEISCQHVRCHCLNFFGDACFQDFYGSWFVLVNKTNHEQNKTNPQPNDRENSREARQAGNRLASWRTAAACRNN